MTNETSNTINTQLLTRDLEELDQLVHRIKTRMCALPSNSSGADNLSKAWKHAAGIISPQRADEILGLVERSRQEWDNHVAKVGQMWHSAE